MILCQKRLGRGTEEMPNHGRKSGSVFMVYLAVSFREETEEAKERGRESTATKHTLWPYELVPLLVPLYCSASNTHLGLAVSRKEDERTPSPLEVAPKTSDRKPCAGFLGRGRTPNGELGGAREGDETRDF